MVTRCSLWPHCCPSFKWLRGGNLEVGEEKEFLMKKYIILFFFPVSVLLFHCATHCGKKSIYYINGEKSKELSWRKTVGKTVKTAYSRLHLSGYNRGWMQA